jgi:hypothetical protein
MTKAKMILSRIGEIYKKYNRIWLVIDKKGINIYWKYDDIPKGEASE